MLILVSSLSAPSGISIEASPKVTIPPSSAEIRTSDFSSFETETARDTGFETALSSSAKAATGPKHRRKPARQPHVTDSPLLSCS